LQLHGRHSLRRNDVAGRGRLAQRVLAAQLRRLVPDVVGRADVLKRFRALQDEQPGEFLPDHPGRRGRTGAVHLVLQHLHVAAPSSPRSPPLRMPCRAAPSPSVRRICTGKTRAPTPAKSRRRSSRTPAPPTSSWATASAAAASACPSPIWKATPVPSSAIPTNP